MELPPLPGPRELYDAAPCGLLVLDGTGRILDVNQTLCTWLRRDARQLLGAMRLHDLLTMGGRIFYQTHLAPLLRMQGSVAEVKLELRTADDRTIPMMLNLAEHAWQGRTLVQVAAFVAEDRHKYERELLVQRRRAEELAAQHARDQQELARAQAEAEDRALFAEQMMGIVSHDLRNPLSVIQMSALLLARAGSLSDSQRTAVDRVARSVQRAEGLIADLLDFTEARLGRGLRVRPVPVDLHAAVAEGLAELRLAYPDQELRHDAVGPGKCHADVDRVNQAVGNLVTNAVRYGAPGKPVTVSTEAADGRILVRVHNLGKPIPPELQATLFEPMVRGQGGVGGTRGVGLGLYIVREIARGHGGTVEVHSSPEEGTTFTLALPRQDGADAP